jgi:hypothetical protein
LLINSTDLTQYVDDPFLFLGRQRLTGFLSRIKIFEKILNVKGSIIECGVHKGSSLMLYNHLSSIMEPYAFNRKIYGFDTFEGFTSITEHDKNASSNGLEEGGMSDVDYDLLKKVIEIHDLDRAIPNVPKCELIKGDAVKSIPEFKEKHPELIIALLYLDFDIYKPTKVALENFLELVPKGGIDAFDELSSDKWAGETTALREVLDLRNIKLEKFWFDPWVSYFVVGS